MKEIAILVVVVPIFSGVPLVDFCFQRFLPKIRMPVATMLPYIVNLAATKKLYIYIYAHISVVFCGKNLFEYLNIPFLYDNDNDYVMML